MNDKVSMEELKDLIPYLLGILSTGIALKKDWIATQLGHKKSKTQLAADAEDVEAKALKNVEATVTIYQRMMSDLEQRFTTQIASLNLKVDALEQRNSQLEKLIEEQKTFIQKQSRSLQYFKEKCKGCPTFEGGPETPEKTE